MLMRVKLESALYDYDVAAGYRQLVFGNLAFSVNFLLSQHI